MRRKWKKPDSPVRKPRMDWEIKKNRLPLHLREVSVDKGVRRVKEHANERPTEGFMSYLRRIKGSSTYTPRIPLFRQNLMRSVAVLAHERTIKGQKWMSLLSFQEEEEDRRPLWGGRVTNHLHLCANDLERKRRGKESVEGVIAADYANEGSRITPLFLEKKERRPLSASGRVYQFLSQQNNLMIGNVAHSTVFLLGE